ncbi:MAG: Rpn family recombination-promoting nuclease/putative transposase [Planctomycetota bacterium]|nr:Rpn family recombination-promoting nuclease/putative transposase [Planctomycetota bacterium]
MDRARNSRQRVTIRALVIERQDLAFREQRSSSFGRRLFNVWFNVKSPQLTKRRKVRVNAIVNELPEASSRANSELLNCGLPTYFRLVPMSVGIDPKVDFAFKLVFGSPDHPRITTHFLNAVLMPPDPITSVEILNPIQGKDRSEDKLVVLDVLAEDITGRRFNIEMQTTVPTDLPKRLTYYNCLNFIRQLSEGKPYHELQPAISICVLDRVLFREVTDYHLSFRLRCDQRDLVFSEDLVFHTLELPKYTLPSDNVVRQLVPLEKWLCFLKRGEYMAPSELAELFEDEVFREAAGVLEMISQSPDDRQFYESRMKFLHDEEARLIAARKEGLATGFATGREKGREEGRKEGRKEGREEGREEGVLAGQIQLLQVLLGEEKTSMADLLPHGIATLTATLLELQTRLRSRGS